MISRTLIGLVAAASLAQAAESTLTYPALVERLVDLEQLATLPPAGETCAQWSSYDRASKFENGKYIGWDANGDGGGIIRKEGDAQVFAEMEGPGCIYRIWSAAPKAGRVRIYLDGASEPAVDLPFAHYFDGRHAPFTRSALVHETAKGWNNYTPIPYQKSCKIVADRDWGQYFQFVYTTFPKGTQVPTFSMKLRPEDEKALDRAQGLLSSCGPAQPARAKVKESRVALSPGDARVVSSLKGPAAIVGLQFKLNLPPRPDDVELLRSLALQIRWDNDTQPAVWSPLGDFFGTAPGANPYRSYPLGLTEDGWWYCTWFMPYGKSAEIKLVNEGKTKIEGRVRVQTRPLTGDISRFGRFHAKWHRDAFLPVERERAIDWTMLKTEGRGRFVGVMLHIWNPRGSWWGEGDEKFFVDGEKFPSTIGTGSEDYFGYAWCDPGLFQNAFHNQTRNDGNNKGHVSVNRWHLADNIPFQKSFEAAIEKYYANQRPTLYSAVAYWYQAPGSKDAYGPVPLPERTGYWTNVETPKVKGAIEGERLKILSRTAGNPQEQDLTGFSGQWSNDAHLWWIDAKPGDKLVLALPVAKTGAYRLVAQFTQARDYGMAQLYLDGQKLGDPIDFYNPEVVPFGPRDLGTHRLEAGPRSLTVEITGANEKAVKSYMFGLDYVKLEAIAE